jgi:hypothetical protein
LPIVCTATRQDGRPCRAWAVPGSRPPRCPAHGRRTESPAAIALPLPLAGLPDPRPAAVGQGRGRRAGKPARPARPVDGADLAGELAAVRAAVRRIRHLVKDEKALAENAVLVGLLFRGSETIARLLQAQQALSGEAADCLAELVQVLDELGIEWQVEL